MQLVDEHRGLGTGMPGAPTLPGRHLTRYLYPFGALFAGSLPLLFLLVLDGVSPATAQDASEGETGLLVLYTLTNLIVGASSFIVAITLFRLDRKRRRGLAVIWPFIALGLFCLCNGLAHAILSMMAWKTASWLALSIQYLSGISAMGLAVIVPPTLPSLLRLMRSAHSSDQHRNMVEVTNAELMKANDALKVEILERKKAEDKERTNLQRVRGIIDNLPLGAIAFDETDRVLHANNLFCQLFELGAEASALIGHHNTEFADLIQKQVRNKEQYVRHLHDLSHAKRPVLGTEIALKDGRTLAQDFIPLFANGRYTGQLFIYRDITKEKRIDATKSEFMSLASHQLRTPLTTMRWSFGRLNRSLKGRMDVNEERLLQEAKGAAGRMAHTIDTMLAISRVEAGKISLEISDIKLGNTVNEVRTECREEYEQKRQSFTIDCPNGLHLHTDPFVFKEILRNLFTNAIKYTPDHGSIHVRVSTLRQHVQIDVSDSGYGIPHHQQEKIFSKFFRGDNIVQRDTEGTGLGLYLVFLLVKLLGATIFFVSEEGKGTTFTLLLPRSFSLFTQTVDEATTV